MSDKAKQQPENAVDSWNTYWEGDRSSPAFSSSGVSHDDIDAFWSSFFADAKSRYQHPRMIDIASGNGALPELAYLVFDDAPINISCVDSSTAAINNILARFPEVEGIVSDAREINVKEESYDLVTSQFGVEYAGLEAIDQAIKLVAPGGTLGFVMHYQDGRISSESTANLEAIKAVQDSAFIELSLDLFRNGFAAMAGNAERAPYDEAASKLATVLPTVERTLEQYGDDIAGGTVYRLYHDIGRIHSGLPNYNADEVLGWLESMQVELKAYADRMASMLAASLDADLFELIRAKFDQQQFEFEYQAALLELETKFPLAWVITARKR